MKKALLLLWASIFTLAAWGDEPFRKHRYDLFKVLPPAEGSIVFVGNSITDMHPWVEAFRSDNEIPLPIVNRGNSGTYSTEQSDNLESYLINKPQKLFLMIGTNDIATSGGLNFEPTQVFAYVKSIVQRIHKRSPETQVYLQSILNNNTSNRPAERWLETNRLVKAFVEETNEDWLKYVDLYDMLSGVASGGVWSYDNLHLTAASYQKWVETLCDQYLLDCEPSHPYYLNNASEQQQNGGLSGSHGMRATYFSLLPIQSDDILFFGDEEVKNGEWNELFGNSHFKNRGSGWGYGGLSLENASKIVEATFSQTDVAKQHPKAILVYAGTSDITGSDDIETVKLNYTRLMETIIANSPESRIFLIGVHPTNNATTNTTRIAVLNEYLSTLGPDQVKYIDCYTPFLDGDVANTTYIKNTNYLYGLGYVKMANIIKDALAEDFPDETFQVITEEEAANRIAQADLRNSIGQALTAGHVGTVGTGMGQYGEAGMAAFNAKAEEAYTLLAKSSISETEAADMASALRTAVAEALNQPTASTEGNEHWYQIHSLRANNYYITSQGSAAGVVSSDTTSIYARSMWKFVRRDDGSYDIIDRAFNAYLNPTAAYNSQITTTATRPASGWTLSYGNTPGYYIISSGEVQLNQTKAAQGYKLYNWSNESTKGADRSDTGCQFLIEEAPEPVEEPTFVEDQGYSFLLSEEPTADAWGETVHWYKMKTTRNAWLVANTGTDVDMATTEPADDNEYGLWCITGNTVSGYTLYNKAKGPGMKVTYASVADNQKAVMAATGTYTAFILNASTAATDSYAFHYGDNCYLNNRSNKLATWNDTHGANDGGSSFLFTEVSDEPLPSELSITVDKPNGTLYNGSGGTTGNYFSTWKSTLRPQVTFGCGTTNNMNWSGDNLQLFTGTSASSAYTLTAPAGYVIDSYSFTFANNGHTTGLTLTMDDGTVYTTSQTAATRSASNVALSSVGFTLAGTNGQGVVLTDFTLHIKKDVPEPPVISTEGNEHWYYITSASSNAYCAGKVMYYDAEQDRMRFGDKSFSPDRVWSFWEQDGKLAIKNYNGDYIGTAGAGTGGTTQFGKSEEPNYIYTVQSAYGFFTIKDSGVELHAQQAGAVIVRWGAAEDNASLWRFDAVDTSHPEAVLASTTVKQGKVTTGIGNTDQPIVRTTLRVSGLTGSVNVSAIKGHVVATDLADVKSVKAYLATNNRELFIDKDQKMTWREENGTLLGEANSIGADGAFDIHFSQDLPVGEHNLWIAYDIAEDATEGHTVDATVSGYVVDGTEVAEANGNPQYAVTIFLSEGAALMPYDCGSRYYRIPAITTVKKRLDDGTIVDRLVTLTDDRLQHNGDLPNMLYIVAQYSDDLGRTWTRPQRVAAGENLGGNYGHGDASIVTDRDNGNIIGIMTAAGTYGHGFWASTAAEPQLWKTIMSSDGGETWTTPVDHTKSLYGVDSPNPTWKGGFSGSGAALQKRDGTLVSSFVNRDANDVRNFHFFMSFDHGQSWQVVGTSGTTNADEPKTLERNNGDLSIFVRANGYNYHNVTSDNGTTWHYAPETRFTSGISGTACDGEYMTWCSTLDGNLWDIAFETLPNSSSRQNVSICLSTDEGETFGTPKTICPWGSGYSTAVVLPDGTLGVYYEEDGYYNANNYVLRFVRFSLDWASDGQYQFTEEQPFHPILSSYIPTGISHATAPAADSFIYDLQGRRLKDAPTPGIYIRNRQKVLIK
ncbi:MAG: GDSL-type esterase/lipase family protein [Bacteroidales bacterium]|nr:GDSL-type esterase/lipase family protein [Bacteroidales bacterium]